jgi:hypothetical protein
LAGAAGASDFFSGSVAGAGAAGVIGDDSAGFAGSLAGAGAGVSAAGGVAVFAASGAGADVEAAGFSSGFFSSWQADNPTAAQVMTASASLLLNLFTCFLFFILEFGWPPTVRDRAPVPHHEVPSAGYTFAKLRHKPAFVLTGEEFLRCGARRSQPYVLTLTKALSITFASRDIDRKRAGAGFPAPARMS